MCERMNMLESKRRIGYIDLYKATGIILMIMGHIGFGAPFSKLIHGFHMPMFFFASGFLFHAKRKEELRLRDYVLRKARTLILPYFIFGFIWGGINWIINGFDKQSLINIICFSTKGIPIAGALWFLPALFFADVMYFFINRYVNNGYLKATICVLTALFGNIVPVTLPFAIGSACVGVGFMEMGHQARTLSIKKRLSSRIKPGIGIIISIVLLSVSVCIVFINDEVNMREGHYGLIPLFWFSSVVICSSIMYLSYLWMKLAVFKRFTDVMCSIGRESIVYLCLNEPVIALTIRLRDVLPLPSIVSQLLVFVSTMIILFVASKIIFKTKMRALFGK